MGWRYIVAIRREDHDRIVDPAEIREAVFANPQRALFQAVADEQILDDCQDFFAAEEIEAAPPALEREKPLALGIDVGEQVGVFFPYCFRLQVLEILNQPGAVQPSISEVGQEVGRPSATEEASGNAHRVDAGIARPIGERRTIEDNWPRQALTIGCEKRSGPSHLAVAVEDGNNPGCRCATSLTKRRKAWWISASV